MLMAPRHGRKAANAPELTGWAHPRGAVTIRSHQTGLAVETFVTWQRFVLWTERAAQ